MSIARCWKNLRSTRKALGGQVFDVLGKLQLKDRALHDLLIEAIRYGERPEVRARLTKVVAGAVDRSPVGGFVGGTCAGTRSDGCPAGCAASARRWNGPRRAVSSPTLSSNSSSLPSPFGRHHTSREARRYELTHVPAAIRNPRNHNRHWGTSAGAL